MEEEKYVRFESPEQAIEQVERIKGQLDRFWEAEGELRELLERRLAIEGALKSYLKDASSIISTVLALLPQEKKEKKSKRKKEKRLEKLKKELMQLRKEIRG